MQIFKLNFPLEGLFILSININLDLISAYKCVCFINIQPVPVCGGMERDVSHSSAFSTLLILFLCSVPPKVTVGLIRPEAHYIFGGHVLLTNRQQSGSFGPKNKP